MVKNLGKDQSCHIDKPVLKTIPELCIVSKLGMGSQDFTLTDFVIYDRSVQDLSTWSLGLNSLTKTRTGLVMFRLWNAGVLKQMPYCLWTSAGKKLAFWINSPPGKYNRIPEDPLIEPFVSLRDHGQVA